MDEIEQALRYPYDAPEGAYLFDAATGEVHDLDLASLEVGRRVVVLAIGSNRSPERLRQKFVEGRGGPDGLIPVVPVTLTGYDVVYAAMVAKYGAVPATLIESEGCQVHIHALVVDLAQRDHLDQTEGVPWSYDVIGVPGSAVTAPVVLPERLSAYRATAGPLQIDGGPLALAAVAASGRAVPAMTEEELLGRVAAVEGVGLDELVRRLGADETYRRAVGARLRG